MNKQAKMRMFIFLGIQNKFQLPGLQQIMLSFLSNSIIYFGN